MGRKKVTVIGGGHVGATTAQRIAEAELADVVLLDIADEMAMGKALDLNEAGPVMGYDMRLTGGGDYALAAGSDIVVMTAGIARKPGMSRDDLLKTNASIVRGCMEQIAKHCPNAIVIVVTNPLDVMAYVAHKVTGFPRERVIGMAGVLDTARYRFFIAEKLGVSVDNIQAFVLGGHGDDMVPLPRYTTIAGVPLPDLMDKADIDAIVDRTRKGGAEIVKLLKTGSAYYAPAASVYDMVDAILKDKKKILPCAAYLEGEYGLNDQFVGVPCKLGAAGLEKIMEIELTDTEKSELYESASHVKETCGTLNELGVFS